MSAPIDPSQYPTFPGRDAEASFFNVRFGDWLRALFNTRRDYDLRHINDEVLPTFSLNGTYEERALRDERSFMATIVVPAVALQTGHGALRFRTTDNDNTIMAMIDKIIVSSAVAGQIALIIGSGIIPAGNGDVILPRDTRNFNRLSPTPTNTVFKQSALENVFGNSGALPTSRLYGGRFDLTANTPLVIEPEFVLTAVDGASDTFIGAEHQTVNTPFNVTFLWRERPMADLEQINLPA